MNRLTPTLVSALLLASCANVPPAAAAADRLNVLIMGEDADRDTIPRDGRAFRRVQDALSNQLNAAGFDVFDEAAASGADFAPARARRPDAELIQIARSLRRPPVDVVVLFSVYAGAEPARYTTRIRARIAGRLLAVRTGRRLGNFEVESPRHWNAPAECARACVLEAVGRNARALAQDLGAVLAEKLTDLVARTGAAPRPAADPALDNGYTLVLDGFDRDEAMEIEEYLVAYTGYRRHRLVYASARRHEYWYESAIAAARLNRNLRKTLDRLGLRGRVAFSGSVFSVQKITFRGKR